jgi:putative spermidine/putrescine transport system ATP-binding protein
VTAVVISELTRSFGAARAVDRLSLSIGSGEFVSLLGPSGCGKTTTLKLIAGFEEAEHGSIAFDGRDVSALPPERRDIGMVFQSYALFPHMTVARNLAFGLEMRKLGRAEIADRVARVLEMVQLRGMEERYPRELSGGQQQRVALARALVIEPSILLLDEPLANLDARLRDEMRVFIRDLQRRVGITTIYVTHDQAEAMTMSDRVVVMFGGRIVQAGAPEAIYERPADARVASFVGQANLLPGIVVANGADAKIRTVFGDCAAEGLDNTAPGASVRALLRPEAITLAPAGIGTTATEGVVEGRYYLGNMVNYRIRLPDGSDVEAHSLTQTRFIEGQRVAVRPPAAPLWVVPEAP